MNVLDELRVQVHRSLWSWAAENDDLRRCIDTDFAEFEEKHPGLIDKTKACENCGTPLLNYYEDGSAGPLNNLGWKYVWTFKGSKWLEPFEVDDEELHNIWLCCPACAKGAE